MTPGFNEQPIASTQTEDAMPDEEVPNFLREVEDIRKKPTNEISKEEAQKKGRETLKAFIQRNKQDIDNSSTFSLDAYAPDRKAEDLPEVCNELARKQTKLEKLDKKISHLKDLWDKAEPGTVEQKVCGHAVAAFENEKIKTEHQIDDLKKQIKKSDIKLTR